MTTFFGHSFSAVITIAFLFLGVLSEQPCERLKATLTYTQEKAPRDLSGLVSGIIDVVKASVFVVARSSWILIWAYWLSYFLLVWAALTTI
jgi:Trk-type K+ transport system membrane component